jgi:RNA polymerase sigma factor (sigma-70 family)
MFKKRKYSDAELVTLVKQGKSDAALNYLYKITQPKILALVLKNNGSEEEAQDIFQDSVIAFYSYVIENKFKESESVEGFIYAVAQNKWINRAKVRHKTTGLSEDYFLASDEFQTQESDHKKIEVLLAHLGEVCRELLTYSIFYKMTMEDIALRMSYSNANAVKTKNYKCKQRLIALVKDKESLMSYLYNE